MAVFRRAVEIALLLTVLATAIWAVAWIAPNATGSAPTGKSFWDIASAIGTIAAAVVALSIAVGQSKRQTRSEIAHAKLTAAALAERIAVVLENAEGTAVWHSLFAGMPDGNPKDYKFWLAMMEAQDIPSPDEIAALSPLPGDCAINLAEGFGTLAAATKTMRFLLGDYDLIPGKNRTEISMRLAKQLVRAVSLIREGHLVCIAEAKSR